MPPDFLPARFAWEIPFHNISGRGLVVAIRVDKALVLRKFIVLVDKLHAQCMGQLEEVAADAQSPRVARCEDLYRLQTLTINGNPVQTVIVARHARPASRGYLRQPVPERFFCIADVVEAKALIRAELMPFDQGGIVHLLFAKRRIQAMPGCKHIS